MGGFSLKDLKTIAESGAEVFKATSEIGKGIEEHGKTKRYKLETEVTKEKNFQDYNIGKISTVLRNSVDIVNCLINVYRVIDDGYDSKRRLKLEEERIEN